MSDTSLYFLAHYGSGRRADGYELVEADYDSIERKLLEFYADTGYLPFHDAVESGGAPTSLQDAPAGAIVTQPPREDR